MEHSNWLDGSSEPFSSLQLSRDENDPFDVDQLPVPQIQKGTADDSAMKENSVPLEETSDASESIDSFLRLPSPPIDIKIEVTDEDIVENIGPVPSEDSINENEEVEILEPRDSKENVISLEKTGADDQSLAHFLRMPSPIYGDDTEVIDEVEVTNDEEEEMLSLSNENEKVEIFVLKADDNNGMSSQTHDDETDISGDEEVMHREKVAPYQFDFGEFSKSQSQDYSENGREVAEILKGVREKNLKNPVLSQLESPLQSLENNSDDQNEEIESLEVLRAKNIAKMTAFINSLRNPEMEQQIAKKLKRKVPSSTKTFTNQKPKRTRKQRDSTVRFNVRIPVEIRKSGRLKKQEPHYREEDLDNIHENVRNVYLKRSNTSSDDRFIEDLENIVYKPKRKRTGFQKKEEERIIIPVEEVTQVMLDNIAVRVKGKVYSPIGTTCHQCRQKTLDQKTCCRNLNCTGIQGMFCGVCIKNRYGEDCAEALLNPNWICPVCRGKCNCSICRNRQGKRPTGVLTPLALQQGYESVDHFLTGLRGEGDKPEEDHRWALQRDSEALLGFSDSGRRAHMRDDNVVNMNCVSCAMTDCDNSENLLGFSADGRFAVMGGYKLEPLHCMFEK